MIDFFKKHKKAFIAFLVALMTASIAFFNSIIGCTSSGQWNATFKKYNPYPEYNYNQPTHNVNEQGGIYQ